MIDGWMPSVGSSSSSTFGSLASARADRQLLLLTAGQIAAAPAGEIGQDRKQVEDLLRDVALAGDHEAGFDIFLDRHGAENLPALRHVSEAVRDPLIARQPRDVGAVDDDRPERAGMTPMSDFISVDFPMPLRPTSATISPARADRSMACRTSLCP